MNSVKGDNHEQGMIRLTAVAKISPKGQITVPVGIRRVLGVNEGDNIIFELHIDGRIEVKGFHTPDTILSLVGILQSPVELLDMQALRSGAVDEMVQSEIGKDFLNGNFKESKP